MKKLFLKYHPQNFRFHIFLFLVLILFHGFLNGQILINEGSNRNYLGIADENGEYPDWIEIYNAGTDTVNLLNYSITDDDAEPLKWTFPNVSIAPGEFRVIFCSDKDRKPVSGFINVANTGTFSAVVGWNTHVFSTPFYWDGISNLLINTCSYSSTGYTTNSVFNQSITPEFSTVFSFQDGSPWACSATYGSLVKQRPNMRLNDVVVGTGSVQNSPYDYPAPYGNWYWGARNQMLILASELADAGLTPGYIDSLSFDVVSTDTNTIYDYIDIYMKMLDTDLLSAMFEPVDTNNFLHTNFKISSSGETIYLYSPDQTLVSSLYVNCNDLDNSSGLYPDASPDNYLFQLSTPGFSNNTSVPYTTYLLPPVFTPTSGIFSQPVFVGMINPNGVNSVIRYTMDGSDPTISSFLYTGNPVYIASSTPLKARVFGDNSIPSQITVSSYLFNIDHTTPVLSVVTDHDNLYGENGIFDHWEFDWERAAYVDYFDSINNLIFSQKAGIQIDGGAGGSRSHPQHSFRVELDDGVLGSGPVYYPIIPDRSERLKYSKIYLRNGSNQYLGFPYKDGVEVRTMSGETNNYYSSWRPISVYINGEYFGLYELREKLDAEYFDIYDDADPDSMDILTLSYWYGQALRALEGSVDSFYVSYELFNALNPADTSYWSDADQHFDLEWYTDYIIAESWIANTDWPWNNIKIYRSDKTNFRWRFITIDLEWALAPNGWTDCYFDHIGYMLGQGNGIPYINVWLKSIQNERYRNFFINRYADVMNTAYLPDRLLAIENNFYELMVNEMPNEYARWGDPNNIGEQMENFCNNHLTFQSQLSLRTEQVRNHIQSHFDLPNQVDLTLDVNPPGAGKIHISTITPETYPWQGVYFNGVPVRIEAIENPGFDFSHWDSNGLIADPLNPVFLGNLDAPSVSFVAYFNPGTTSVDPETGHSKDFSLFPVPAKNQLFLFNHTDEILQNIDYQVVDLNGNVLLTGQLKDPGKKAEIDISSIPSSVYVLRLFRSTEPIGQLRFITIY